MLSRWRLPPARGIRHGATSPMACIAAQLRGHARQIVCCQAGVLGGLARLPCRLGHAVDGIGDIAGTFRRFTDVAADLPRGGGLLLDRAGDDGLEAASLLDALSDLADRHHPGGDVPAYL